MSCGLLFWEKGLWIRRRSETSMGLSRLGIAAELLKRPVEKLKKREEGDKVDF